MEKVCLSENSFQNCVKYQLKIRINKLKTIKRVESITNFSASISNWMDMEMKMVSIYLEKKLKNILMNLSKMDNN